MPHKRAFLKLSVLALAASAAVSTGMATAQVASVPISQGENIPARWFVELSGRPVIEGGSVASVQSEQAAFRAAALAAGVKYIERRSYNNLFNGFSVEVSDTDRSRLARLSGVRSMYPVEVVHAPNPVREATDAPNLATAIAMSGASVAQTSGFTGQGVRVAVIDSGVDIDNPAFGGTGIRGTTPFPNARVVAGWDFVGDNYNAAGTTAGELTPVPDGDPRDCAATGTSPITPTSSAAGGHGTHVAGIVGANGGGLVGVAPGAGIGAYRVFGCYGSTGTDVQLAALERAHMDGMQVINMSLGSSRGWPISPTGQAISRLARKGVVMAISIGNAGPGGSQPDGLWAASSPGVTDGAIGTASFDNTHVVQPAFTVANVAHGYTASNGGNAAVPTSGTAPLVRTGTTSSTNDACSALPAGSLNGAIALIRRGTCGFYNKAINAQNAGAVGVVLYNNQAGILSPTVSIPAGSPPGSPTVNIPVVMVTQSIGGTLDGAIQSGPQTLTWSTPTSFPSATGGLISGFSSFGLAPDLSFKPNIGAPGGSILSAYPLELGGRATLSGTSMASPHIAGVAALVLQAVPGSALGRFSALSGPNTPPAAPMLTRLMNTAKPKLWSLNTGLGLLDHTFRQGAGMVDVMAAIQTKQFVVPASIAAGESAGGPKTHRLTIRNDATTPVTFTLGHVGALGAGPNVPLNPTAATTSWSLGTNFFTPAGTVAFSSNTVTVPARGAATVDATISDATNGGLFGSLYGGYITLTPQGGTEPTLRVPYAGFVGDYQATQVLRAGTLGLPWIAKRSGTSLLNCASPTNAPCSFSMVGNDIPVMMLGMAHQARQVKFEAFDTASSTSRGVISVTDYVTRPANPNGFFTWTWDGTTSMGTQPNGSYFVRGSILKPLGDPANPAHWEVFNTVSVNIARP